MSINASAINGFANNSIISSRRARIIAALPKRPRIHKSQSILRQHEVLVPFEDSVINIQINLRGNIQNQSVELDNSITPFINIKNLKQKDLIAVNINNLKITHHE